MRTVRFAAAFMLLVVCLFGLLALGIYWLITGDPGRTLLTVVATIISGRILPRPVAWLVSIGSRP